MNQIMLLLGLKTDAFEGGAKRAIVAAKEIGHEWHGLKKVFELGGVLTAALFFFREITDNAAETKKALEEMGQPVPTSVRLVADLGDSMNQVGSAAVQMVGFVVGGMAQLGDVIGTGINMLRGFSEAEQNVIESSGRLAEQAEARLAKVRRENNPEAVMAAERHLGEVRRQNEMARLDGEQKMGALLADNVRLHDLINSTKDGTLVRVKAEEELERNRTEIYKLNLELNKQRADAQQKLAEQQKRAAEEDLRWYKDRVSLEDKLHDQRVEAMSGDERLAAYAADITRLKAERARYDKDSNDYLAASVRLGEVEKKQGEERISQAERLAAAEKKRITIAEGVAKAAEMTKKAYESVIFSMTNGGHSSEQIQSSEGGALQELKRRNDARLADLQKNPGSAFDYGNSMEILRLRNENARIQKELDMRDSIRTDAAFGGVDYARSNFRGDPLVFDRLFEQFVKTQTETGQLTRTVQKLVDRIGPDQAGNLPSSVESLSDTMRKGFVSLSETLRGSRS